MQLIIIFLLNVLLTANAVEDNLININYVTSDGLTHDGIAINGNIELPHDWVVWATYQNNINKTGYVYNF